MKGKTVRGQTYPWKQQRLSEKQYWLCQSSTTRGWCWELESIPWPCNASVENPRGIMLVVSWDKAGHTQDVWAVPCRPCVEAFGVYPTWAGALLEFCMHRKGNLLLTAERNALLKRGIIPFFYLKYCQNFSCFRVVIKKKIDCEGVWLPIF